MSIVEVSDLYLVGGLSLLSAMKILNNLGYTKQERKQIIEGWELYKKS